MYKVFNLRAFPGIYTIGITATLVAVAGIFFSRMFLLHHDIAAMLLLAERFPFDIGGVYRETVVIQTPIVHYFFSIPVLVSQYFGWFLPNTAFVVFFVVVYGCLLLSIGLFLALPLFENKRMRWGMSLVLAYLFFVFPLLVPHSDFSTFGLREHLFCVMVTPYIFCSLLPEKYRSHDVWYIMLRMGIGVLAMVGCAMKPHFLIVFIAIEIGLACCFRSLRYGLRIEAITFVVLTIIYYGWWWMGYPECFAVSKYYREIYEGYTSSHAVFSLWGWFVIAGVALLTMYYFLQPSEITFFSLIGSITVGCVIVALLQPTAMAYQKMPFFFFLFLGGAVLGLYYIERLMFLWLGIVSCVMYMAASPAIYFPRYERYIYNIMDEVGTDITGKTVMPLSGSIYPIYTIMLYQHASMLSPMWFFMHIPVSYMEDIEVNGKKVSYHSPEEMDVTERFFHEAIIKQFMESPPEIVWVERRERKQAMQGALFDILAYLKADPRFEVMWKKHYTQLKKTEEVILYQYKKK